MTYRPHPGLSPPAHPTRIANLDPHQMHHRDHLITGTSRDNIASRKNYLDYPPGSLPHVGAHKATPSLNETDLTSHSLANASQRARPQPTRLGGVSPSAHLPRPVHTRAPTEQQHPTITKQRLRPPRQSRPAPTFPPSHAMRTGLVYYKRTPTETS